MSQVTIKVRDNGPFLVEGPVTVIDAVGNAFAIPANKPAIALCRCGQSNNKPFCDGTHKTCGFTAAERAAIPPPPDVMPISPPSSPPGS
jgi:CDGSH-type Zn-finger protein